MSAYVPQAAREDCASELLYADRISEERAEFIISAFWMLVLTTGPPSRPRHPPCARLVFCILAFCSTHAHALPGLHTNFDVSFRRRCLVMVADLLLQAWHSKRVRNLFRR